MSRIAAVSKPRSRNELRAALRIRAPVSSPFGAAFTSVRVEDRSEIVGPPVRRLADNLNVFKFDITPGRGCCQEKSEHVQIRSALVGWPACDCRNFLADAPKVGWFNRRSTIFAQVRADHLKPKGL